MSNDIIKISNLYHKYGKGKKTIFALNGIDLNIKEGQSVAFIGPDGVGKSTLLDIISGVKSFDKNSEVLVFGSSIKNSKHRNKISPDVAYMPQGLGKNLYGDLSIYVQ